VALKKIRKHLSFSEWHTDVFSLTLAAADT
jgi:hypothetical protein